MVKTTVTSILLLLRSLLLLSPATEAATSTSNGKPKGMELADAQIEWLRSKGGYYNPKVAINPLFESDSPQVPLGLFARESFVKGEQIMVVPRHCLLTAGPDSEDMCDTAVNLVRERQLGDKSAFEPYVSYLYSKESISLPSSWSTLGKKLILMIRGSHLPPNDLTDVSFANQCADHMHETTASLQELEFAYLSVVSRAWSDKLVPVFDMINHHSGRFANVDSTRVHGTDDVTIYATRDIPAGEQLFLSYMDCVDERGYELEYVLPQMLRDFGIVDEYPQRWIFPVEPEHDLVFDLDFAEPDRAQEMRITWRSNEPSPRQIEFLQRQLKRLGTLQRPVMRLASLLESDWEREVSLNYYDSLSLALKYASGNVTHHASDDIARPDGFCTTLMTGDICGLENKLSPEGNTPYGIPIPKLASNSEVAAANDVMLGATARGNAVEDMLMQKPALNSEVVAAAKDNVQDPTANAPDEWMCCDDHLKVQDDFELVHRFESHYQDVEFFYDNKTDDSCLYLDGYLHTCASARPHYHEVFVHYAARFVDQLKRVIFIGGGDSMVLHEVLKYPSLELVVGLELDQAVVRASFQNLGTQPHWDNEKVEWYFGDAAKSLSVLPRSYFATFDLVIVDILTEVAASLKVNDELTLLDAAMLLMKPEGIVVKNEDQGYVPGSSSGSTKYAVDLAFHDVPIYCLQVFVAASNAVDFLVAEPKDHNVETLYLKGIDEFQSQFDSWHNFGVTQNESSKCNQAESTGSNQTDVFGVLMILEAEKTPLQLDSATILVANFSRVLANAGLSKIDSFSFPLSMEEGQGYSIVILTREGHISARCIPSLQYCAIDIQLFGDAIDKLPSLKAELYEVLQNQHSSSYRYVTGGVYGLDPEGSKLIGPPTAKELCDLETDTIRFDSPRQQVRKEKRAKEFDSPQPATLHSYDDVSGLKQWYSQKAVANQAFVQFRVPKFWVGQDVLILHDGVWLAGSIVNIGTLGYHVKYEGGTPPESAVIESRVKKLSEPLDKVIVLDCIRRVLNLIFRTAELDEKLAAVEMSAHTGDGLMVAIAWEGGTVVAVWDGRTRLSVNLFMSTVNIDMFELFAEVVEEQNPKMLKLETRDDFPRGTGSVVNFADDIEDEAPLWGR